MRSKVKKALCCAAALAVTAGISAMAACSSVYEADALSGDYSYTDVVSNGGFAVEAGNYIYFINGVESEDADNTFGDVQKGAIVRISKDDYAAGNYSTVQTVVPLIAYTEDYEDTGIYIYGDYIYYATPSTNRDSSGTVLSSTLEFKSTKLDGTGTMKDAYISIEDNSTMDYRYVYDEKNDTVYLLYVLSEAIFDDVSSTAYNLHSLNLSTGENTLIAYGVDEYCFDSSDLESPWVYYTMDVTYNIGSGYDGSSSYSSTAGYNQVYRACAYETTDFSFSAADKYDFSYVNDYDYDSNPLYVNRGEMVFDGIGAFTQMTQFNYGWEDYAEENGLTAKDTMTGYRQDTSTLSGYSYSLTGYADGNLYYTRSYYSSDSSSTPIWFYVTDEEIDMGFASGDGWNAVSENPQVLDDTTGNNLDSHVLLLNADSISDYTIYTNDNDIPKYVLYTQSANSGYSIMWGQFEDGAVSSDPLKTYRVTKTNDSVSYLTTNTETVDGTEYTFLYYSVSDEGNSYSVHRIALYGTYYDYNMEPAYDSTYKGDDEAKIALRNAASNYRDVQILDLDVASWYMPEIIENQMLFATASDDMSDYTYIMVFDLRASTFNSSNTSGGTVCNYELSAINDLYNDVVDEIENTDEDNYENLLDALYYVFYTRDVDYLEELVNLWVDEGEDEQYLYSTESQQMYKDFCNAEGDYAELFGDSADWSNKSYSNLAKYKTINGETVYATSRDYYYTLIGYMSDDDYDDYIDGMRSSYMQSEPEEESWWDSLETWEKVLFIVGISVGGVIVLGAATITIIVVIRKKRKKLPSYTKRKIKVDTTDDMDIDVYSTEDESSGGEENKE